MNLLTYAGLAVAVFALGGISTWIWIRADTSKGRINAVLGTFFTLVAIIVTAELLTLTARFDAYVGTTVGRDLEQERCAQDTLTALRIWASARTAQTMSARERDQALVDVLMQLQNGGQVDPQTAARAVEATRQAQAAAAEANRAFVDNPLPQCRLAG
jgi:hypothetical protein